MAEANRIHITHKVRIAPRLSESLQILGASSYALGKVLEDYAANPLIEIVPPTQRGPARPHGNSTQPYAHSAETTSLDMHLIGQINLMRCTEAERKALHMIAALLDAKGFFTGSLSAVARQTGLTAAQVDALLEEFKTLDPPGIGARDFKECLQIQLKAKGLLSREAAAILGSYLSELAAENYVCIESATGIPAGDAKTLLAQIKKLNPYPAMLFNPVQPVEYIEPDIVIDVQGEQLHARLNDAAMYRVIVLEADYRALARLASEEERKYLSSVHREALWLKRSMQKRYDTLLKIGARLAVLQREYFRTGNAQLVPLTRQDVARALGIHSSTVCRALSGKYIQSPQGIQPASFYFSGRIQFSEKYSPAQVRQHIENIIRGESRFSPESDGQIAACLNAAGIRISRRTVAKYRQSLGISPAYIRKKHSGPA